MKNLRFMAPTLRSIIFVTLASMGQLAWADNRYIRAGATGSATGMDWVNACTDFTGACAVPSLMRGSTYFVASGKYASRMFNTPTNGTDVITIKGATASDHGTNTGWSPSFGVDVSQAHFRWSGTTAISIQTSHFIFDGNTGSGGNPALYGFIIDPPAEPTTNQTPALFVGVLDSSISTTNVVVKHVAYVGTDPLLHDIDANTFQACGNPGNCTNLTFANNYSAQTVKFLQASSMANSTIEYNYVKSVGANFSAHAELISSNNCHTNDSGLCSGHTTQCVRNECASNNVVRYNYFGPNLGASNTGGIVALDGNPRGLKDWKIYGNVFFGCGGGNGCIATGTSGGVGLVNVWVYNNTFVSAPAGYIFWQCGGTLACSVAGGNIVENNLLYDSNSVFRDAEGGANLSHDYNAFCSPRDTAPSEAHGQTGCGNVFVNATQGGDFRLKTSTTSGKSLPAPFNVDPVGTTRGTDGTWDRGAYEWSQSSKIAPNAPRNLTVL